MKLEASVVVPTRDQSAALALTLVGFANQKDAPPFEVIVVDDGSRDATREILAQRRAIARVKVIHHPAAKGRAAARNAGLKAADGRIVIMNDGDAIPSPELVSAHVAAHSERADAVVLGARFDILARWSPGDDKEPLERLSASAQGTATQAAIARALAGDSVTLLTAEALFADPQAPAQLVISRDKRDEIASDLGRWAAPWISFTTRNASVPAERLRALGGFDEAFHGWGYEDVELGYRLFDSGQQFGFSEEAANHHQWHRPPGELTAVFREAATNYRRFVEKHPSFDVLLYWRLMVGSLSPAAYDELLHALAAMPESLAAVREDFRRVALHLARRYSELEDPTPIGLLKTPLADLLDRDLWNRTFDELGGPARAQALGASDR